MLTEKSNPEKSKITTSSVKEKEDKLDQTQEKYVNIIFGILILPSLIAIYLIVMQIDEYTRPLREGNKEYKFPSVEDFKILYYLCPMTAVNFIFLYK